jgi:hypothetical protein
MNKSLQGKNVTILTTNGKISSLKRKLEFWKFFVELDYYECSSILHDFLTEINFAVDKEVSGTIFQHLRDLALH